MNSLRVFSVAIGGALVLAGGLHAAGFVVNRSNSLPPGVWRVEPRAPQRGDVTLVCPPDEPAIRAARDARYLDRGFCPGGVAPLLKPVVAVAGDRIEVRPEGVSVNGQALPNTRMLAADGAGRRLPDGQVGAHIVRAGEVWLISNYSSLSFDSRYFGPVAAAKMRGVARPVFTEEEPHA